jgi:PAS domain S-box-containing protein
VRLSLSRAIPRVFGDLPPILGPGRREPDQPWPSQALIDAWTALLEQFHERRRLERIIATALDAIILVGADNRIRLFNAAAERIFRCSTADALGHAVDRFIPLSALTPARSKATHTGEGRGEERGANATPLQSLEALRRDGTAFPAEIVVSKVDEAFGGLLTIIVRDVSSRRLAEQALRRVNLHLEEQAKDIAQALHDEAGQLLTSAHIALVDAARDMPQGVRDRLREVQRHLDGIEEQMRRIAHELRPPILDNIRLIPALAFLAEGVEQRWGISVVVEGDVAEPLPHHVEWAVYRLVQEALSNVTRHARATRVTVRLAADQAGVRCTIEDDGVGFDPADVRQASDRPGMGLRGVRDRIEALGGTFDIRSPLGRGVTLVITIPLEA